MEAQAKAAEETFAPAKAKLDAGKGAPEDIDIDKTIRILHQVDESMRHQDDLHTFLAAVAAEDWRGVPAEVLSARQAILDAQLDLYAKQTELDAQEASYTFSRDVVLTTLSVVSLKGEGGLTPDAKFAVDRAAAERRLDELRAAESERRGLLRDIDENERTLIEASVQYAGVWARYMEEYDRVCYHRDRAWMASAREDWPTVERESRAAIALAPHEKEAHMLLARALIEAGGAEREAEAESVLDPFATGTAPGAMAPALLLRGTLRERREDLLGAAEDYQHAALAYPTQAGELDDVLDPYRARASLRKSRAGAGIVESYSATMVGAGWFSPELHLARLAYGRGDREAGKRAVVDHFERRRAQRQWDYVLTDLSWAEQVLGEDFRSIFPEDGWLDLHAEKTMFGLGSEYALAVDNRSAHPLKNAALVLCVRFTDMLSGDYVTFAGERTMPELPARTKTDFGHVNLDTEVFGAPRTEDDVVDVRAILVTDDGVLWVDTEKYKEERLREAREARRATPAATELERWTKVADAAGREAMVSREQGLVNDALQVELPASLVWLKPSFTLHYGELTLAATQNVVDGDKIRLRFDGIGDILTRKDAPPKEAEVVCDSVFGTFTLSFGPKAGGGWTYLGTRAE